MASIDAKPTEDEMSFLDSQLDEFNAQQTGQNGSKPIELVVRDDEGKVVAGLKGLTVFNWLYVGNLWVHADYRSKGLGSELMNAAEATAKERGCIGSCMTSFSFQAPGFYQKRDYEIVGKIADYPPGESLLFFAKRFDR